jgi:hypothetical protein
MRRISLPLAIGALLAVTIAAPVAAQRAVHITGIPIAVSGVDDFLTGVCGYEVTFTLTGTGSATLVYNEAGLIIREVDTAPAARLTFSGNGNSFSYPGSSQIVVTSYPERATIGAPAQTIETGMFQKAPGSIPNAGPDILLGHVVAFTAEGLPLIEFDELLASHGPRPTDFAEEICAALDG